MTLPNPRVVTVTDPHWEAMDRETIIGMVEIAIGFIGKGKPDVATNQLWYLVDTLRVDAAVEMRQVLGDALGQQYISQ